MKTKGRFNKGIIVSNTLIGDYSFKCTNRTKEIHFTRERKMGFKETIMFMINMVNKSLQVELNNYFETILNKDNPSTKQAYSKARQNIEAKRSEEHTSELQSRQYLVCRLLLEK